MQCSDPYQACVSDTDCLSSLYAWQTSLGASPRSQCLDISCTLPFFPDNETSLDLFLNLTACLRFCEAFDLDLSMKTAASNLTVAYGVRVRWSNVLGSAGVVTAFDAAYFASQGSVCAGSHDQVATINLHTLLPPFSDMVLDSGPIPSGSTYTATLLQTGLFLFYVNNKFRMSIQVLEPPSATCPSITSRLEQCVPAPFNAVDVCSTLTQDTCNGLPECTLGPATCVASVQSGNNPSKCAVNSSMAVCLLVQGCIWVANPPCVRNCSQLTSKAQCQSYSTCIWQPCSVSTCGAVTERPTSTSCPSPFTTCDSPLLSPGCTLSSTCLSASYMKSTPPPAVTCSFQNTCPQLSSLCNSVSLQPNSTSTCENAMICASKCGLAAVACLNACSNGLDQYTAQVFASLASCGNLFCNLSTLSHDF